MDFEKAAAAFMRKKKSQDMVSQKREAYQSMLKEFEAMKYDRPIGGVRKERPITQDKIDAIQTEKKERSSFDVVDSLAGFVDIQVNVPTPKNRKADKADPLASLLDMNIDGVKL